MSQLMKVIPAIASRYYFFKIALDHAPEPGEPEALERQIQAAMEQLGVPAERVAVTAFKSSLGDELATGEEPNVTKRGRYLLCIMVRTEEGGYTEDPETVAARTAAAFARYAQTTVDRVAAVVLENAYLEVDTRENPPVAVVTSTVAKRRW